MSDQSQKSFKDTLNLPTTEFSIRANASQTEPEIRARWDRDNLDGVANELNKGKPKFVLHDGPPYSNGHIHMGTALNKTLKDMVCKSKRMFGFHVPFKPGWDCHGLPIELKVATEVAVQADSDPKQKVAFKKACREFSNQWIETQLKEFKQLGVLADWDNKYATMDYSYEADIVRAFATFVEKGFIERKGKTIPWCASCKTSLAYSEIEYKDRKDPSIYILFPLTNQASQHVFKDILAKNPKLQASMLIWTTTPWTIPLNRAITLHPEADYVLVKGAKENEAFIVGKDLAAKTCELVGIPVEILAQFKGVDLKGYKAHHPFVDIQVPFVFDDSVLLTDGTAAVHCAPGCGPEDYLIAVKNGIEIYSPLSGDGKYTKGIQPAELEGMAIADAQGWVIKKLMEVGKLFHKGSISHSYPHCWRCKNGLMFRATDQWFCDLEKNDLVPKTLKEIESIAFVPSWGRNRLSGATGTRTEWCISRQRQWGVPIIALYCKKCQQPYVETTFIRNVAQEIEKGGIEYWDMVTVEQLQSTGIAARLKCSNCSNTEVTQFKKETDILDVWFESGVSHFTVLTRYQKELSFPADMYLEGSDQHRAWFQSSLLTSMVLNDQTCMKTIVTHGYVVDEHGHKMSKSVGNVIAPDEVIKKLSVDILRLWVAGTDFEKDIVISEKLLANIAEVYRKIRNTCRFMLANMYDFSFVKDAVPFDQLQALDRYALLKLAEVNKKVLDSYKEYHFTLIYQTLAGYTANDLSSFYLDILKDRLYTEKSNGLPRRSAQTTLYYILDTLTKLMAPMLSFLAEEVADHYQGAKHPSIHLQPFADLSILNGIPQYEQWPILEHLREAVLKAIELKREVGLVKHSLEAKVTLWLDLSSEQGVAIQQFAQEIAKKEDANRFFKDWFIVSQCEFVESKDGLTQTNAPWVYVNVEHAQGTKCPRCWQWEVTNHVDGLCKRCQRVVNLPARPE